ncbi:hypothetical protein Nekkels1_77 [Cellulophaga phage Nekkels_1]|uniref:Uncharacterized protein n=1 Tax=Cellulophaga phage Nekkels_1 TaxID=2745692 RepID=A0A8E4XV42_9CAUD|nr:hypothetical protein M1M31_gp77 [Cellulophaga phage Nekkels_1]QQO97082.1 hypothetical protein Nekkels1_77 [Cellulophaga phage Nekkels_1]
MEQTEIKTETYRKSIDKLFNDFKDKTGFLAFASEKIGVKASSIHSNWVYKRKDIPVRKLKHFHSLALKWHGKELKNSNKIHINNALDIEVKL